MERFDKLIYRAIQYLKKRRIEAFVIIFSISFFFYLISFNDFKIFKSLYDAGALFALDVRVSPKEIIFWWHNIIYLLALFAGIYTILSVIELFTKDRMKENLKNSILEKEDFIVVVGLGESNRVYIDSELGDNSNEANIIVIELNKNNPYLEVYEDKLAVIVSDAKEKSILEGFRGKKVKHFVISAGDDMTNLDVATQLLAINSDFKLFIHLEDRNLRHFHKENGILSGKNIKVYSYHEEAARELFGTYDIDGETSEVISTEKPFAITVVGNTSLAYEVIAQACIMGQLPNENKMTIYCIDTNVKKFQENVELHFPEIQQVPNVSLEYRELDVDTKSFYTNELWDTEMTNMILCFEDDQKNLDIASNLTNLTYLEAVVDGNMKTNILMAMFNGYSLGESIKNNSNMFKHLHIFGRISDINDMKYVIAGERDKQAIVTDFIYNNIEPKLINYDNYKYEYQTYSEDEEYGASGFIEANDVNWSALSYFKKESNRAVADQMKMKLKYLGLKISHSVTRNTKELYHENRAIFDSKIKDRVLLAKMEHNRWNAFHYLNGFKSIPFVSKKEKSFMKNMHEDRKVHMCLVNFDEFKDTSEKLLELGYKKGEFEGYDFMINEHIPLILANAGYGIEAIRVRQ